MTETNTQVMNRISERNSNLKNWKHESHTEPVRKFSKKMSYRKPRRMSRDYIEDCLNYENED